MMKSTFVHIILGSILCALILCGLGCSQPGETVAEGHRRHLRILPLNQEAMTHDIDVALQMDKPSKLSDKRVP